MLAASFWLLVLVPTSSNSASCGRSFQVCKWAVRQWLLELLWRRGRSGPWSLDAYTLLWPVLRFWCLSFSVPSRSGSFSYFLLECLFTRTLHGVNPILLQNSSSSRHTSLHLRCSAEPTLLSLEHFDSQRCSRIRHWLSLLSA